MREIPKGVDMQKELLLAIDDDRAASYNLRFLKEVFENFCDLKLTLFYVAPFKSGWEIDENNLLPKGPGLNDLYEHVQTKGEKALAEAQKWVADIAGCAGVNISTKVVRSQRGAVGELVHEAREGLYDAVLLGRKGFTWFEEVFENSVSHQLLWGDIDFPVWICKKPPLIPRRDVLLCMDGSPAALRMVDHAGYMLANERHTFTLFHAASSFSSGRSERIFDEALALLDENGIPEDRIEIKMVKASSPEKAVLKEAREGNYTAVCVGKSDDPEPTSKFRQMFPSSFTVKLLRQLEDAALWVSK